MIQLEVGLDRFLTPIWLRFSPIVALTLKSCKIGQDFLITNA